MKRGRDPIERAADDEDLQGIATWEPRTHLDRAATRFAESLLPTARGMLVLTALAFTAVILFVTTIDTPGLPIVGAFVIISIVPALALAAYVYVVDVATQEPLDLLGPTFALSFVFASFAAIVNTAAEGLFFAFGLLGVLAYYLFVVATGEELVKLLAVRFYAYRDPRFDAVIDGAVYGAVAGLGFATIENAIYVSEYVQSATVGTTVEQALDIAQRRALAGPGHVIYSAIAGYYLGLAKFNEEYAGAVVVKGVAIAAGLHAAYNISVSFVPSLIADALAASTLIGFVVFVLAFDGLAGGYLFLKLQRYRRTYDAVDAGRSDDTGDTVDAEGIDPSTTTPPIGADANSERE
jgi:RsiW-degrading membrane proteinase PrsW (M82 family)